MTKSIADLLPTVGPWIGFFLLGGIVFSADLRSKAIHAVQWLFKPRTTGTSKQGASDKEGVPGWAQEPREQERPQPGTPSRAAPRAEKAPVYVSSRDAKRNGGAEGVSLEEAVATVRASGRYNVRKKRGK